MLCFPSLKSCWRMRMWNLKTNWLLRAIDRMKTGGINLELEKQNEGVQETALTAAEQGAAVRVETEGTAQETKRPRRRTPSRGRRIAAEAKTKETAWKVLRTNGLLGLRAAEHRIPEARTRIMRDSPREGPFSGLSRPEDSEALRQELMRTERGGSFLPKQQPDLPQKKERKIRKS